MTLVEDEQKAPFSIVTTPRYRGGRNSFPWIDPLYPWYARYNSDLSKAASSTTFESLVWLDLGLNPGLSGPLANTLLGRLYYTRILLVLLLLLVNLQNALHQKIFPTLASFLNWYRLVIINIFIYFILSLLYPLLMWISSKFLI